MKKLITTILICSLFLLFTDSSKASVLKLRYFEFGKYTVKIGSSAYISSGSSIIIHNLVPGKKYMKIIRHHKPTPLHPSFKEVVFSGIINIPEGAKVTANLNRHYGLNITRIIFFNTVPASVHNVNQAVHHHHNQPDGFMSLKRTIANASFDSDKLRIAKQASINHSLSSKQVREIMELFSFESTKLKYAKFAYSRVLDPQNYFIVNNAFTFSSSIRSLDRYMQKFQM